MAYLQEVRTALRMWARRPATPLVAMGSLAVAIAAATTLFAVADAALWRPLPVREPGRLVWISSVDGGSSGATAPGVFTVWRARAATLRAVGAIRSADGTLRDARGTDRVAGARVTAGFFEALEAPALRGRALLTDDERLGAAPVLVITHRLWISRYGGDGEVVGSSVTLDGIPRTIIGVLGAELDALPFGFEWFAPLSLSAREAVNVGPRYLAVIGRLADASPEAAARELTALAQGSGARADDGTPIAAQVVGARAHFAAGPDRVLVPLLVSVLMLVLIAAANVASLMLAHGSSRRAEIAVRASLGASRARLLRLLATEAGLLAGAAGVMAFLLAAWFSAGLARYLPPDLARVPARVDARAAIFTAVLTMVVLLIVGLIPALRHSRADLRSVLQSATAGGFGGRDRLRRAFVVLQIALAVGLGAAGILMVRTTWALTSAPRGYQSSGVMTAALGFPAANYPGGDDIRRAIEEVVSAATRVGGVARAAVATRVPLSGGAPGSNVALASEAFSPGIDRQTRIRFVTPGYFGTTGIPVLAGRDLLASDRHGAAAVVLVNDSLARRLSPDREVVGRSIRFEVRDFAAPGGTWLVVGRVGDARDRGPRAAAEPEVYVPVAQGPPAVFDWIGRRALLAVQTRPGATLTASDVKGIINTALPQSPAFDIRSLDQRFADHIATERLLAGLFLPLATAGALLAALGVLAVVTQLIVSRRREIALRMVLGATPARILAEASREGWTLTLIGISLGVGAATAAGFALRSVIFGVAAIDPLTLIAVIGVVLVLSAAAILWPARAAASLEPGEVLRG